MVGLKAIAVADALAPILFARSWYLVRAQASFFVTSDSPVVKWVARENYVSRHSDSGFLNPKAEITFPLSPWMLLLMTGDESKGGGLLADAEMVREVNELRAADAERFIYADRKDDQTQAIAKEFKNHKMRARVGDTDGLEVEVVRALS